MATPEPFKINISDHDLDLLRQKLSFVRLPDQPEGYDIKQGIPAPQMQQMLGYWKNTYLPNWPAHEARLNQLPMFTLPVQSDGFGSLNIHLIHARSSRPGAIPLLFVHGWPGSFLEVTKMLGELTEPREETAQAFHVVAPSLPNYGFSDGVKKRGFNLRHYGFVLNSLMLQLGYDQYIAQGGDWGSIIARTMGRHHEQHLRGIHVNLAAINPMSLLKQPWLLLLAVLWPPFWITKENIAGLRRGLNYVTEGNAYYRLHQSGPQTVAYCLEDSPAALLGWIWEKLIHWTDGYEWMPDEVLDWVSIYWFSTAGPGASVRTYFEAENPTPEWNGEVADGKFWDWTKPVLGISQFPKDIVAIPRLAARTLGRVVFEKNHKTGGHFAAWEQPGALVQDLRDMFGPGGGAYGCVESGTVGEEKKFL